MRILFVGDIVGRPGRDILAAALPRLTRRHGIDFVIANAENSAGGFGVTRETGDAIASAESLGQAIQRILPIAGLAVVLVLLTIRLVQRHDFSRSANSE